MYSLAEWSKAAAIKDSHPEVYALLLNQPFPFEYLTRLMVDVAEAYAGKDTAAAFQWLKTPLRRVGYYEAERRIRSVMEKKTHSATGSAPSSSVP